jgi:uncharacterized protein (DUF983 family)
MQIAERFEVSRFTAVVRGLCPRCRQGQIFKRAIYLGLPGMNERCAVCGLKFEREEGYFLGAMYISYALGLPLMAVIVAVLWKTTHWPVQTLIVAAAVALLPFAPFLTVLARVMWIHFDRAVDPD